jgi:hypothetical protein
MTVTMPLESVVGSWSSGENLRVVESLLTAVVTVLSTVVTVVESGELTPQTTESAFGLAAATDTGEDLRARESLPTVVTVLTTVVTVEESGELTPQTTESGLGSAVPANNGVADNISNATPAARPQAALNAGEWSGRFACPLVMGTLWLFFINVL